MAAVICRCICKPCQLIGYCCSGCCKCIGDCCKCIGGCCKCIDNTLRCVFLRKFFSAPFSIYLSISLILNIVVFILAVRYQTLYSGNTSCSSNVSLTLVLSMPLAIFNVIFSTVFYAVINHSELSHNYAHKDCAEISNSVWNSFCYNVPLFFGYIIYFSINITFYCFSFSLSSSCSNDILGQKLLVISIILAVYFAITALLFLPLIIIEGFKKASKIAPCWLIPCFWPCLCLGRFCICFCGDTKDNDMDSRSRKKIARPNTTPMQQTPIQLTVHQTQPYVQSVGYQSMPQTITRVDTFPSQYPIQPLYPQQQYPQQQYPQQYSQQYPQQQYPQQQYPQQYSQQQYSQQSSMPSAPMAQPSYDSNVTVPVFQTNAPQPSNIQPTITLQ